MINMKKTYYHTALFFMLLLISLGTFAQTPREPFFLPNAPINLPMQIPTELHVPMLQTRQGLELNGIMDFGTHKVAIINNKSFRLREEIEFENKKWIVVSITNKQVQLRQQRETKTLTIR